MISIPIKRGEFVALSASSGVVTPPTFPNVVITPPSGQRVRLTHLSTPSSGGETGVNVSFGAAIILNNVTLSGSVPTAGAYSVGSYQPYATGTPPWGNHEYVTGKTDEVLTIAKGGASLNGIYYAYEFGV